MNDFPVDVVIPWVDGNDPAIISKHIKYSTSANETSRADLGGAERFTDTREIEFCVASILTFAPFVRNIFIITDNQNPELSEMLSKYFPDRVDSVKIIDHKEIFKGYEEFLPTFNCNSIETMMWRIPELSEHFIYFNDDVFLTSPVKKADFFSPEGTPIGYWRPISTFWLKLLMVLKPKRNGSKTLGYKHFMLNSARLVNSDIIPMLGHTPYSLTKSGLKKIYEENPQFVTLNISDRFRNHRQFNPQVLFYLTNENEQRDFIDKRIFIKSGKGRTDYIKRKLEKAQKMTNLIFGCINSYDQAGDDDKKIFLNWFSERIINARGTKKVKTNEP